MLQIMVAKDFGEGEEIIVITYGQMGYTYPGDSMPLAAPADVEDSFVGASMFGWDAPIADRAHEWAATADLTLNALEDIKE
jgi:hypothetical protein